MIAHAPWATWGGPRQRSNQMPEPIFRAFYQIIAAVTLNQVLFRSLYAYTQKSEQERIGTFCYQ
jgi:hypothetical protein